MKHGTAGGYRNQGCRCTVCTEAHRVTQARTLAKMRAQGLAPDDSRHGSISTYTNWGCRCQACSNAWSTYDRARRTTR